MKQGNRKDFLKDCMRVGLLAGMAGLCVVLGSRGRNFACRDHCGKCPKLENGKCSLGWK